jgi:hypothetical protein
MDGHEYFELENFLHARLLLALFLAHKKDRQRQDHVALNSSERFTVPVLSEPR